MHAHGGDTLTSTPRAPVQPLAMKRDRQLWLVFVAMLMFAAGVAVVVTAKDTSEHLLGGVAILGALAVVIANVFGNGKGDR